MIEVCIDVRDVKLADRHPAIFSAFDDLPTGGSLVLTNEHDLKPLYGQFQSQRQGTFTWTDLDSGSAAVWRVRITKTVQAVRNQGTCCGHCG